MTSEILLMNKRCVVMAADSGSSGDSGSRIFEISDLPPVGVMVHGRNEIGGVPIEALVDEFKTRMCGCFFESVEDYARAFLHFLDTGTVMEDDVSDGPGIPDYISADGLNDDVLNMWNSVCSYCEDMTVSLADADAPADFETNLGDLLDGLIVFGFGADQEEREEIKKMISDNADLEDLLFHLQMNDEYVLDIEPYFDRILDLFALGLAGGLTDNVFGPSAELVFAGYGEGELLPALIECEVRGHYFGKTFFTLGLEHDVATGKKGAVLPYDLSPRMERFIAGLNIESYDDMVEFATIKLSTAPLPDGSDLTEEDIDAIIEVFDEEVDDFNNACREAVFDYVKDLSKEDMAATAEFMVNMNNLGWAMDGDGDICGDIEVAVLSKEGGFMWVLD